MPRPEVLYVESPKQWEVLLSPVRRELVQALRCLGACTAAQMARMLDRPADTLYRHLEKLKLAGFVVEVGERKKGRHHERLFDVTADDFAMNFSDINSTDGHAAVSSTARAYLGAISTSIDDSLEAGALELAEGHRNFVINYELSWLTPEKFKKARALMYQIKLLMDEARPKREGRLYCSITAMCPVTRVKRRSARTGGPPESEAE